MGIYQISDWRFITDDKVVCAMHKCAWVVVHRWCVPVPEAAPAACRSS
jgi:hypothetical protein